MGNWGAGTAFGPIDFFSIPTANVLLRIKSTHSAVTIQKVALYEGAYTIDTLPGYISNTKHIEMLNCNVPLAPHNLLDNSDFSNPIAQAGLNGMHGSSKYVCDRWISWDKDATFGSGYITPESPIDQHLSKTVVDINKTYTAAICLSDGTIKADYGTFSNGFGSYALGIYCMKQEGSTDYVTVRLNTGNNVRWASLYEGAYDASTLPAYQPKGYAAELAECMRYYYQSWTGSSPVTTAGMKTVEAYSNYGTSLMDLPQEMRANPTITVYDVKDGTTNQVREWVNETIVILNSATVNYCSNKRFSLAGGGNFIKNEHYYFHYSASADL